VVDDALYSFKTLSDWGLVLSILLPYKEGPFRAQNPIIKFRSMLSYKRTLIMDEIIVAGIRTFALLTIVQKNLK